MNYPPASILTLHRKDAVSPYLFIFLNAMCACGNMHRKMLRCTYRKRGATILATVKVVMCWLCHLSLCDQICALRLVFVMHLAVMIRPDKNFTDTNHLNQYPSF
jgi:hypothetical protein